MIHGSEFRTSAGGVMRRAPAGSFTLGSPETELGHRVWERQRTVTFDRDFYLGQTPVTQREYEAVTGSNPTDHEAVPQAPVDALTWDEANAYCRKLSEIDRESGVLPADWEYRLPTEAEWEYACRAGSSEPRYGPPKEVAWHFDNAENKPHAVGEKEPNAWGFHDKLGNLWEWCQDWFYNANPSRSARGGSYFNSVQFCRAAQRWGWNPNSRGRYCGFRLLAAPNGPFELTPPLDEFPKQPRPPSIYDAMDTNDFELARKIVAENPAAVETVDAIPPPLHTCVYQDNPEMLAWLLDHGATIERLEQDYGSTPLNTAVVMRRERIIRILVERGADTSGAMDRAQRGLAGEFEDDAALSREGYRAIVELLRELGVDSL